MLAALILILYISSIKSDDVIQFSNNTDCILPPHPKNGRYNILEPEIPNLAPGDKLRNFTLEVECYPGFRTSEYPLFQCFEGEIFGPSQQIMDCLPYCSTTSSNVISCGIGSDVEESRCLLAEDKILKGNRHLEEELVCGITGPIYVTVIAGGHHAEKQELPWHAGIYTKTKTPYMQICGGSLVSPTVVISAAHCFWSNVEKQRPASNYAVAVGKLYRPWNEKHDENAQKSDVAEIKIPPRFQGSATNLQEDIALVVVSSPFQYTENVRPVCLNFNFMNDARQLSAGNLGKVAGWGLTSENGQASQVLKVVEMPVVAIEECIQKSDPAFKVHITSDKICAGYQNGTAVCRGDSGGGLSFPEVIGGVKRYFLRGVVSAAPSSQDLCNTIAWATFTHVLKHEHFIRETVPELSMSSSMAAVSRASLFLETEFTTQVKEMAAAELK